MPKLKTTDHFYNCLTFAVRDPKNEPVAAGETATKTLPSMKDIFEAARADDLTPVRTLIERVPHETDGYIDFIYDDEPLEQEIAIILDKNGSSVKIESNSDAGCVAVYQNLMALDWNWIEV